MSRTAVFFCAVLIFSGSFVYAEDKHPPSAPLVSPEVVKSIEICHSLHEALFKRKGDLAQFQVSAPSFPELKKFNSNDIEKLFNDLKTLDEIETSCQALKSKKIEDFDEKTDAETSKACLPFGERVSELAKHIKEAREKVKTKPGKGESSIIPLHKDPETMRKLDALAKSAYAWKPDVTLKDYHASIAPKMTKFFERAAKGKVLAESPSSVSPGHVSGGKPVILPAPGEKKPLMPPIKAPPKYIHTNPQSKETSSPLSKRIPVVGSDSPFEAIVLRYGMDATRDPAKGQSDWVAAIYAEKKGCGAKRKESPPGKCEGVFLGVVPFDDVIQGTSPYARVAKIVDKEYEVYVRLDASEDRSQGKVERDALKKKEADRQREKKAWEERKETSDVALDAKAKDFKERQSRLKLKAFIEKELETADGDYKSRLQMLKNAIDDYKKASARDRPTHLAHIKFRLSQLQAFLGEKVRSYDLADGDALGLDAQSIGPRLDVRISDAQPGRDLELLKKTIEQKEVTAKHLEDLLAQIPTMRTNYPGKTEALTALEKLLQEAKDAKGGDRRKEALEKARAQAAELKKYLDSKRAVTLGNASRTVQSMRQDLVEGCQDRGMPLSVLDRGQDEKDPKDDRPYNLCAVNVPLLKLGYRGKKNARPFDPNLQMFVVLPNEDGGKLLQGMRSLKGLSLKKDMVLYPHLFSGEVVINPDSGTFLVKGPSDKQPVVLNEIDIGLELPTLAAKDKRGLVRIRLAQSKTEDDGRVGFQYGVGDLRAVDRKPKDQKEEKVVKGPSRTEELDYGPALEGNLLKRKSADPKVTQACQGANKVLLPLSKGDICLEKREDGFYQEPETQDGYRYAFTIRVRQDKDGRQGVEILQARREYIGGSQEQVKAPEPSTPGQVPAPPSKVKKERGRGRSSRGRGTGSAETPADQGLNADTLARIETAVGDSQRRFPISGCKASKISVEIPGVGSRALCLKQTGSGILEEPETKDGSKYSFFYEERGGKKILTSVRKN